MGLADRDYYREEFARKYRAELARARPPLHLDQSAWDDAASRSPMARPHPRSLRLNRGFWLIGCVLAVAIGITLAAPPIFASRCDQMAWRMQPVACWKYSWQALNAQAERNTAAPGWHMTVIYGGR
jgi:hypothetical protein